MYLEFTPSPHLKLCSLKPPNISMKLTLLPLHRTSSHISVAFTPPSTPFFLNPPLLFCDSPAMLKPLGLFQLWLSYKLLIFSDPKISPFCCLKPLLFVGMSIPWAMASTPSLKISESPGWAHIRVFHSSKWQPTPVLLSGEFHGQRSLVGYNPWGLKESDTTK